MVVRPRVDEKNMTLIELREELLARGALTTGMADRRKSALQVRSRSFSSVLPFALLRSIQRKYYCDPRPSTVVESPCTSVRARAPGGVGYARHLQRGP